MSLPAPATFDGWARALLAPVLVTLAVLASGDLECSTAAQARVEHGGDLYARMCAVCHGAKGEGYKADQATALAHPDFLATASNDYLRGAIINGRVGTTMSAWGIERGGPLKPADVDALVSFVRTWSRRARDELDERPPAGDPGRGYGAYARECARCHGPHGMGGPNVNIGNADLLKSAGNGFLRHAMRNGRAGTLMPAFAATLGDDGIEDVLAMLRSWEKAALAPPPPPPARTPPIPLGPVPLNPKGPEPVGFHPSPATTPVDVVKAQLDRGARLALLDARAPSDYANEHIAGAVSVPFYDPEPYIKDLPRDAWLVCYCSCPHAESGQLAAKLAAKGFSKVTVLDEGLRVWSARKYPTHNGLDP